MADDNLIVFDSCSHSVGLMTMQVRYQKCLFRVRMDENDFQDDPQMRHQLEIATAWDYDEAAQEKISEKVERYCQELCSPKIKSLAIDAPTLPFAGTLEELLHPVTFDIRLSATKEEPQKITILPSDQYAVETWFAQLPLSTLQENKYNFVPATELLMLGQIYDQYVQKVLWEDKTCVFKTAHEGCLYTLQREIDIYMKLNTIHDNKRAMLRIPQLHGIVTSNDQAVGLLLEYITDSDNLTAEKLLKAPLRQKLAWVDQIRKMVKILHAHGIVWGDVKTENVVIDDAANAWLIDFGGGNTDGWIDRDKAETVEGDLQGLERIEDVLDPEASPAREGADG